MNEISCKCLISQKGNEKNEVTAAVPSILLLQHMLSAIKDDVILIRGQLQQEGCISMRMEQIN